ncbi:heparan-alpha-glucosaminide N-acetyltransferase domain-containing protein [Pseudonocardia sediminis]|uniref:heparan-alpha-glucosaminide N-acetyltransferase domain-containing protein n=1 Tax=Pseudonocardia sediminis TaxID=1397368 RepID=UPI001F5E9498|nr:heparan-alpha-glucosaminide N-acetyltransferase domain-containing protein [Pseudonocardia sediminis]
MDVARGIALLGMIAVHALVGITDDGAPTTSYMTFGGRSAALFAVLTGVAFAFMTRRRRVRPGAEARAAAAALGARACGLLLIGLALGWTDPEIAAVIMPYYAVMFVLAIPLVLLPTGILVGSAVLLVVGVPALSQLIRPALPQPALTNPGFSDLFSDPLGLLSELTLTGAYPALPWLAYLCVGIAVGRARLSSVRTALALLIGGTAAAVAATALSAWLLGPLGGYARIAAATPAAELAEAPRVADFVAISPEGVTPTSTWWWLATVAPHSGTPLDLAQTIGSALAVLGAALLLAHVGRPVAARLLGHLLRPLAAAGSMTLTLYVLSLLFMNSPLDEFEALPGYLFQIVMAMTIAVVWRKAVGRGPLEAALSILATAAGNRVRRDAGDGDPTARARASAAAHERGPTS